MKRKHKSNRVVVNTTIVPEIEYGILSAFYDDS